MFLTSLTFAFSALLPFAQMHRLSSVTATCVGTVWAAQRARQVVKVIEGVEMSNVELRTNVLLIL